MNSTPHTLLVRKLDIDLSQGFSRHWHSQDAFLSMYFNALSMSFPEGEQFFIDSVRGALPLLPDLPEHQALRETISQFIGQEATHRQLHHLYNTHLEKQCLVNRWQHWTRRRISIAKKLNLHPLSLLAVTAAYEHCTAVFADGTLRYSDWFEGAEPHMQMLWRWHAAEETEHKAVAFDLYRTLGGSNLRRCAWYVHVLLLFTLEASRQTLLNLWRDKSLFHVSTLGSALKFMLGRKGSLWRCTRPLLQYFKPSFHPNDHDNRTLAEGWLTAHTASWRSVR